MHQLFCLCRRHVVAGAAALIGLLAMAGQSAAGPLTLSGQVTTAGSSFTISQLQAIGGISETVGADNYVGVSLWGLLGGTAAGASNVVTSGGGNNAILRNYVVATGADGSRSIVSIGEINPLFGGTGQPYLVAYEKNGALLSAPMLVVPDAGNGSRNIGSLADLSVFSAPRPPAGPGGTTTQFSLSGVNNPGIFDLAALQAMPATTAHDVTFFSGSNPNGPHDYTGVALWTLLANAGVGDPLTSVLLATGSDGYQVLFSLAELNPAFGAASDLIAYAMDGAPLGSSGFARTVLSGDLRGGRYVSNLASLEVVAINGVDEPSILALLGIALLGIRVAPRKRRLA